MPGTGRHSGQKCELGAEPLLEMLTVSEGEPSLRHPVLCVTTENSPETEKSWDHGKGFEIEEV